MKKCIFRKNIFGFGEWCDYVRPIMNQVNSYNSCLSETKAEYYSLYENQLNEYKIIIEYKKKLNEKQLMVFDKYLTRHHIVPNEIKFSRTDYLEMFDIWLDVRFSNNKIINIKDYSSDELGKLIFESRLYDGRNRIEVAEIIGISPNTLKMYEEGKRMIPANVFLMLNQIYGKVINLNDCFETNPLKN